MNHTQRPTRRSRKIRNFALPIFWEPELLTARELYEERAAQAEYEAEMAGERYFENGRRYHSEDFYEMEQEEKALACLAPPMY